MLSVSVAKFAAVVSSSALLFSSSFAGVWTFSESIGNAIAQQLRGRPGHFTDRPDRSSYRKSVVSLQE